VSQSENIKSMAAEARIEETRSFVRTVKGATRCKYPTEEKIRIVLEGFRLGGRDQPFWARRYLRSVLRYRQFAPFLTVVLRSSFENS
jgi:hypothetical protein